MLPWENKDVWLESQATARALTQPASYNDIASMWTTTWSDILAQKGTSLEQFRNIERRVQKQDRLVRKVRDALQAQAKARTDAIAPPGARAEAAAPKPTP